MKSILTIIAAGAALFFFVPSSEANPYSSCGSRSYGYSSHGGYHGSGHSYGRSSYHGSRSSYGRGYSSYRPSYSHSYRSYGGHGCRR